MRRLSLALLLIGGLALGGCSTHEVRFEGDVPPQPLSPQERVDTAHEIIRTLLDHFAQSGRRVPPSAAAPFAEAAVLDAQATHSLASAADARRLGRSLLGGRIPVGVGLAYPGADGRTPDPQVTVEVARTLLTLSQVLQGPHYRPAAARVAQAIITSRMGWTRLRDGYAVREPGARRRYSVALTAEAGVVLARLAAVGGGPLAERYANSALGTVRRAQIAPGRWHKSLGGNGPMPVAERSLTLFALHASPSKPDQDIATGALPNLFEETFQPWGEPRDAKLVGKRGIGVALALRTLYLEPGTSISEHVTRWFVTHRRSDGTFEAAAPDDAVAQAYFALAFGYRAYIYAKGGLP
ncbi:MAG: hypothetical protein QOI98_1821 [Solirubrobacteraceae bacterium]|nr:hypothetical protein [Solirubrobacteraceae bacterium]